MKVSKVGFIVLFLCLTSISLSKVFAQTELRDMLADTATVRKLNGIKVKTSSEGDIKTRVRCYSTCLDPLILVDKEEIKTEQLSNIDPHAIESMYVLSVKEATEKYGEKGKNGAILITMKKEKKDTVD